MQRIAVEVDNRQERSAGDAGVRVGLNDAGNGCGYIEISFLRRLDDFGQFARTERTPPVDRGTAASAAVGLRGPYS